MSESLNAGNLRRLNCPVLHRGLVPGLPVPIVALIRAQELFVALIRAQELFVALGGALSGRCLREPSGPESGSWSEGAPPMVGAGSGRLTPVPVGLLVSALGTQQGHFDVFQPDVRARSKVRLMLGSQEQFSIDGSGFDQVTNSPGGSAAHPVRILPAPSRDSLFPRPARDPSMGQGIERELAREVTCALMC